MTPPAMVSCRSSDGFQQLNTQRAIITARVFTMRQHRPCDTGSGVRVLPCKGLEVFQAIIPVCNRADDQAIQHILFYHVSPEMGFQEYQHWSTPAAEAAPPGTSMPCCLKVVLMTLS